MKLKSLCKYSYLATRFLIIYLLQHVKDLWHLELHKTFAFLQLHLLDKHCPLEYFLQLHCFIPCPPNEEDIADIFLNGNLACKYKNIAHKKIEFMFIGIIVKIVIEPLEDHQSKFLLGLEGQRFEVTSH